MGCASCLLVAAVGRKPARAASPWPGACYRLGSDRGSRNDDARCCRSGHAADPVASQGEHVEAGRVAHSGQGAQICPERRLARAKFPAASMPPRCAPSAPCRGLTGATALSRANSPTGMSHGVRVRQSAALSKGSPDSRHTLFTGNWRQGGQLGPTRSGARCPGLGRAVSVPNHRG